MAHALQSLRSEVVSALFSCSIEDLRDLSSFIGADSDTTQWTKDLWCSNLVKVVMVASPAVLLQFCGRLEVPVDLDAQASLDALLMPPSAPQVPVPQAPKGI
jgi:hypothetical protein